jgi:hypothetical protein
VIGNLSADNPTYRKRFIEAGAIETIMAIKTWYSEEMQFSLKFKACWTLASICRAAPSSLH